nr:MAG: polyprotein [Coypu sapelovirus 1]
MVTIEFNLFCCDSFVFLSSFQELIKIRAMAYKITKFYGPITIVCFEDHNTWIVGIDKYKLFRLPVDVSLNWKPELPLTKWNLEELNYNDLVSVLRAQNWPDTPVTRHLRRVKMIFDYGQGQSTSSGNVGARAGKNSRISFNFFGDMSSEVRTKQKMDLPDLNDVLGIADKLDNPSVEEMGYSDRLLELNQGTTIVTSQESAGAVCAYRRFPKPFDVNAVVDKKTTPGPAVDRFYTIGNYDLTQDSEGVLFRVPLPGALASVGVFGQNFHYHQYWRGGFCVHVQCNATAFHQGALVVAVIPECVINAFSLNPEKNPHLDASLVMQQMTLFPHQLINFRSNNSATIVMPYVSPFPIEDGRIHNPFSIVCYVVEKLKYSPGATTSLPITISIAPMVSEFHAIRQYNNQITPQGVPTIALPGSGQFVTTLNMEPVPVYPLFCPTSGFENPGRVKNLLEVARIPTFVNNFGFDVNVVTTADDTAPLFVSKLSFLSDFFKGSYLGNFVRFYSMYRGSIIVDFIFTGPKMATGKFLVAYTPPGNGRPTTRLQASQATSVVWDIGLQSCLSFTIPYYESTMFRTVSVANDFTSMFGFLSFWYQTSIIVPPNTPTTCKILMMVRAGKDFVVRLPVAKATLQGIEVDGASQLVEGESGVITNKKPDYIDRFYSCCIDESKLKYFFSRSFPLVSFKLNTLRKTGGILPYANISLEFPFSDVSVVSTSSITAVKGNFLPMLMKMFTYWRCSFEVTVVVTLINVVNDDVTKPMSLAGADHRYQVVYTPPSDDSVPGGYKSASWYGNLSPSVFANVSDPPARLKIPFVSYACAYSSFYDGENVFTSQPSPNSTTALLDRLYKKNPANNIGTLSVRIITGVPETNTDTPAATSYAEYSVTVFMKPLKPRAYIPRPLTANSPPTAIQVTRGGRKRYRSMTPNVREFFGIEKCIYLSNFEVSVLENDKIISSLRVFHFKDGKFIAPCHLDWNACEGKGVILRKVLVKKFGYPLLGRMRNIVKIEHKDLMFFEIECVEPLPFYCGDKFVFSDVSIYKPRVGIYDYVCGHSSFPIQDELHAWIVRDHIIIKAATFSDWEDFVLCKSTDGRVHAKTGVIMAVCDTTFGDCGGLLYDDEKIYGMLTSGIDNLTGFSAFTLRGYHTAHNMRGKMIMNDFGNVMDTMGARFGNAAAEGALQQLIQQSDTMMAQAARTGQHVLLKVLKYLSKIIGMCVAIYYSENRLATVTSLGLIVGPDFIEDPFKKLYSSLGIVTCQSAWFSLRTFVECCNAGRGLEWLIDRITKFLSAMQIFASEDVIEFKKCMEFYTEIRKQFEEEKDGVKRHRLCQMIVRLHDLSEKIPIPKNINVKCFQDLCRKARIELRTGFAKVRPEPVVIVLKGTAGVGKSVMANMIAKALAAPYGGGTWSMPPGCKHFDGYVGQPVVIMDDLAQSPDGEDCKLFCQMVSSAPFVCPMADLSEKGTYFTSKFVIVTTNHKDLAPVTISFPEAMNRRFYLDVSVNVHEDFQLNFSEKGINKMRMNYRKCVRPFTCQCTVKNFDKSVPLLCGCGVYCVNNRDPSEEWSCDEVITKMLREYVKRKDLKDELDEIKPVVCFAQNGYGTQGLCEEISHIVSGSSSRTLAKAVVRQTVCHETIRKLRGCPEGEAIFNVLKENKWEIDFIADEQAVTSSWIDWLSLCSSALSIVMSAGTLFYLLYVIFSSQQGPYTGRQPQELSEPKKKRVPVVKAQGPNDQFAKKMFDSNVRPIKGRNGSFSCIGIHDGVCVVPTHFECEKDEFVELDGVQVKVLDVQDFSDGNFLLEVRKLVLDINNNKFKDIRKFLPDGFERMNDARLVVRNENFTHLAPVGDVDYKGLVNLEGNFRNRILQYHYPTRSGQCGGAVVVAGKVCGMHIGGDGKNGYAALLKRSYFADPAKEQGVKVNERKAPRSVNVRNYSSFRPSVFHDVFKGKKQPAALSPKDKRLLVDFDKAIFAKYKGNVNLSEEDKQLFKDCVDFYYAKIRPLLPENVTEPLSLDEVVDGIEGLQGLDLNTSAGYPYNTMGISKRSLVSDRKRLMDALDLHGYGLPFTTYLKDELRPFEKIQMGKTRVIEASSINDTIRMKMVFGRFFQMMHKNPGTVTGSAVGCNPDYHWTHFAAEIGDDNICAFDYSNWDASLSPFFFEMLKYFFCKIGYNKDIVDSIINHICNSVHIYKDVMYDVIGGMPSGCSGTSIFNSLINNWCVMWMVMHSYSGIDLDKLRILCYGDDLLVSYPFPLDPEELALSGKELGLTMTPPDKSEKFNGCIPLKEASFLKRKFIRDEVFPFLVHPVFEPSEIEESIRWTRNPAQTQEHVWSLCELKWHEGKQAYEDFLEKINSVPFSKCLVLFPHSYYRNKWLGLF